MEKKKRGEQGRACEPMGFLRSPNICIARNVDNQGCAGRSECAGESLRRSQSWRRIGVRIYITFDGREGDGGRARARKGVVSMRGKRLTNKNAGSWERAGGASNQVSGYLREQEMGGGAAIAAF